MGKNDFLTPKAIANRIKAKGLQKLRWYCQMCQKQCRDENGFKCHCMSESHQRQMQVFGQNPHRFVGGYSEEFETAFMEHMKRSHRFSRVAATVVYNEYIADRHHVHMNSTKWVTLTEFVKYLGKTGKCKVEETPKGWFITYNDKEPETLLKEGLKNKRQKAEVADADRHERMIAGQIERAAKFAKLESPEEDASSSLPSDEENQGTFQREEKIEKIAFSLGGFKPQAPSSSDVVAHNIKPSVFEDEEEKVGGKSDRLRPMLKDKRDQAGALHEIMTEQERAKEKVNRKDYWLYEGLVVKVMSKALAEKGYYKQKGTVMKVVGKYVGEIEMLESGDMLKVDQEELETVIPQIGGLVKIVNGAYRGSNARLLSVDTSNFCVKVQIEKGMYDGRVLPSVLYEDVCKCTPNA